MGQDYSIEQLNHGRKIIDFMRYDILAFIVSSLLILASIIIINIRGFYWGLDFTGGVIIEINLEKPVTVDLIRKELLKANFNDPLVQNLGSSRNVIIRLALINNHNSHELGDRVISTIKNKVHQNIIVKRIEFVGPSVGKDLAYSGVIAILSALFFVLIYIGFRFEWCLAFSIVLSLIHDLIINCGILSLFHIEIDLTILASLMSVISYSLNDKIVVSDRIRENFRKIRWGSARDITNVSLTQTLNRTLITSLTTLAIILILFIFGGTLLTGFSLTMLIGVTIGTFSSIYISSALALRLGMKREYMLFKTVDKKTAN